MTKAKNLNWQHRCKRERCGHTYASHGSELNGPCQAQRPKTGNACKCKGFKP